MPESADLRELIVRHRRRLCLLLRALLPAAADADAAWRDTVRRIYDRARGSRPDSFAEWSEGIARDVAFERRKGQNALPFSDDLFRQLADSAASSLAVCDERPRALAEIIERLPPPERELLRRRYGVGLSAEQIAMSDGRPAAIVARDLTLLHGMLVSALREALKDDGPAPPGGAGDLGRIADQLLDGTATADSRMVLETLLLADAPAQAHYHRHVALAVELEWKYQGAPELPDPPQPAPRRVSTREWIVTGIFVAACLAAVGFAVLAFTGRLRIPW